MIKNLINIVLILAFVAVIVFLDVPGVQNVLNLRKDIASQKEIFIQAQTLGDKLEKLTKSYEENKDSVEKSNYILPSDEEVATLTVQFEALAFEQGLVLEKIEFTTLKQEITIREGESQPPPPNYQILNVTTKLAGTYPALKNFLRAVEENIRLMDVDSINFSVSSEETPEIFDFDLSLNTYYQ